MYFLFWRKLTIPALLLIVAWTEKETYAVCIITCTNYDFLVYSLLKAHHVTQLANSICTAQLFRCYKSELVYMAIPLFFLKKNNTMDIFLGTLLLHLLFNSRLLTSDNFQHCAFFSLFHFFRLSNLPTITAGSCWEVWQTTCCRTHRALWQLSRGSKDRASLQRYDRGW